MKRILTAFLVAAAAGFLLFVCMRQLPTASAAADEVTIKGTVQAVTDDDDQVIGTYIETEDQDFVVADTPVGRELRRHVGKMVEVKGELKAADEDEGDPTIIVKSYKLIEDSSAAR